MLSSQGTTSTTSGMKVSQSVGQLSSIGNYSGSGLIVGQGFQQSRNMKTVKYTEVNVKTTVYPNPFIDQINFEFSSMILGSIKFSLYDVTGRLINCQEKSASDNVLTISQLSLAEGEYFVKLSAKNYNFSTNLLKSK